MARGAREGVGGREERDGIGGEAVQAQPRRRLRARALGDERPQRLLADEHADEPRPPPREPLQRLEQHVGALDVRPPAEGEHDLGVGRQAERRPRRVPAGAVGEALGDDRVRHDDDPARVDAATPRQLRQPGRDRDHARHPAAGDEPHLHQVLEPLPGRVAAKAGVQMPDARRADRCGRGGRLDVGRGEVAVDDRGAGLAGERAQSGADGAPARLEDRPVHAGGVEVGEPRLPARAVGEHEVGAQAEAVADRDGEPQLTGHEVAEVRALPQRDLEHGGTAHRALPRACARMAASAAGPSASSVHRSFE